MTTHLDGQSVTKLIKMIISAVLTKLDSVQRDQDSGQSQDIPVSGLSQVLHFSNHLCFSIVASTS